MQYTATNLLIFCLISGAAFGNSGQIENITLDVPDSRIEVDLEDGRFYHLSSATTTIEIEGRWVGIYRWILSARDTSRISARLIDEQWEPVESTAQLLPGHPILKVHSSQVWGRMWVVLLDLYPWRILDDRVEVLKGGRVEITIHHRADDSVVESVNLPFPDSRITNRLMVQARPSTRSLLRRLAGTIPEEGSWLKIPIREDGLYHLTTGYLTDAGLFVGDLNPTTLRLFAPASLGRPLPDQVGAPLEDNLMELPIHVRDGGDGLLGEGDDILFYAQGPRGLKLVGDSLTFIQNPYTNEAYVWLHIPPIPDGTGAERMTRGPTFVPAVDVITTGRNLYHHEVDVHNGFHSGPVWHQVAIKKGDSFTISLPVEGLRSDKPAYLRVQLRGGNETGYHQVTLTLNQALLLTSTIWTAHGDITLVPDPGVVAGAANTGSNVIILENITTNPDPQEEVWLDWAELDYGLDLTAEEDALAFLISPQAEENNIRLVDFSSRPIVMDITNPASPVLFLGDQQVHQEGSNWLFTPQDLSMARRYLALTDEKLKTTGSPTLYNSLDFTTLRHQNHQADYIVITNDTLLSAARDLAAIHAGEVRTGLQRDTLVTIVDEIYEEFSGGVADPFAIRAFLRWVYENRSAPDDSILVVLFGDGDYDYRNLSGLSRMFVPTIQVDGSSEISSRAVDDAFVYLDSIPVSKPLPDMGIGRITVSTLEDAEAAVEGVRTYMVNPEPGPWRQRVLLAADDPQRPNDRETSFITESDGLARILPPYLQLEKIYLTEYTAIRDPATNTVVKPDATVDLIGSVNRGIALINYVGHGSASQWAQEQLLVMDRDQVLIHPGKRMPIWFAGTCTWGRFDQLQTPSMSEILTTGSESAAIAVVSAVRAVYASANFRFIKDLFTETFPERKPSPLRIGQILQRAKTGSTSDEKFHLFGDPAILIAFPRGSLTLDAVTPDTLKVLGKANYAGTTAGGTVTTGECLITVLDVPRRVRRTFQAKSGAIDTIAYTLPGAPIFRGSVTVTASSFQGQFVIPKDISYSYSDSATIIAYSWSDVQGTLLEQIGYRNDLIIRGTDQDIQDNTGPLITLYWEDRPVVSGDALPEGAQLEVELKDPLGINLTGEVGHSIRTWVDDESAAQVMDTRFRYDIDKYTIGRFDYRFEPALSGSHQFSVEAWDGANNRAISTLTLHLTLEEELDVHDLLNFPNPFSETTTFVYSLSVPADVTITIYTLNGVKVRILEAVADQSGFQRLPWNGTDEFGDQIANGAYLYHFRAATFDDQAITRWGRLARLR
ncbi:MAG: type IX secretion system sortase PorU [Fidelibacterota bacterium]|nr:MAG: type IX secretion system sortase PorU [Candidatus Neomarinimicrobiota bacterium]